MLLHLSDLSPEPLHAQISRQIRARILSGDLEEGSQLPSIRTLARKLNVSVITTQRAYEDLDREGVINSRKGKGFFVAELTDEQKLKMALDRFRGNLRPIVSDALAGGLSQSDVKRTLEDIMRSGGKRE